MIASRHRKLEVIKSSLTVSFAPIRFRDSTFLSRSFRSFARKRLHLIPDSVQFPSTPLLSSLSPFLSLFRSLSLRMLVSPAAIGIYGYGL